MIKKKYNDDLFVYLNWILKKPIKELEVQSTPSIFITNRWLSMTEVGIANIVNNTFNRWVTQKNFNSDPIMAGKFYKILIPKNNKRISYIKKPTTETNKESEDVLLMSQNLEISQREIELYNQTLDIVQSKLK